MESKLARVWLSHWQAWESPQATPDLGRFLSERASATPADKLDVFLQDQRYRWQTPHPLRVEDYLQHAPELCDDHERLMQLTVGEFQSRLDGHTVVSVDEYTARFSHLGEALRSRLQQVVSKVAPLGEQSQQANPVEIDPYETAPPDANSLNLITRIGRYRRMRLLGEGTFGLVWLGMDEELHRRIAIKVPKPERFRGPEDAEQYLVEARMVAGLDHPHIVPVYDVGHTESGSVYVVSKFIEGCTLADRLKSQKLSYDEVAKLLATAAQALHHAHKQRLIHRDVKPANILIEERTGTTYVADFGLAIREEDYLRDSRLAGTPGYMSPEQARGEGHRLDGRSDIFSLGVIMYEMLTGKRPFGGSTTNELLHQVVSVEPTPPRTLDNTIPAELDRICLKALSKRAADRYATGNEFAHDLSHWQQGPEISVRERVIVPKGLRSFDADDADFFLDLLPGPRDRDGLPESIRFWKKRIEETDAENTFSVGLIYGPSGCGKSSLVKAGLIPRLSKHVVAIYIEATPDETETRILRALNKTVMDLPTDLTLPETFAWLRRRPISGQALATGYVDSKIVIILDQFEQWLHSHRSEQGTDLITALRQCDGGQLQAIAMVRDDFAMAAARFMDSLEVPILQGENFATVDLFDVHHAEQVLMKFGRAFGKLPANSGILSVDQQAFVSAVASGLANDGKVVSVRLSLFAEMIKGKPWTLQTLRNVGGTDGIGVNFLEDTFSSRNANPKHRLHEQAARAVLKSLLPVVTTDIKGHMRSHSELLADAGYESRPTEFNSLLRILDGELRLITPTDPAGLSDSSRDSSLATRYYQLTHDYMVPSLRDWLTRKQQETRAGRAELKLAERTNLWTAKPENRYLPSIAEWGAIRTLTNRTKWTPPQDTMMRRAFKVHGLTMGLAFASLLAFVVVGVVIRGQVLEQQEATRIEGLVGRLVSAEPAQVSDIVRELDANPELASRFLAPLISTNAKTGDEKHLRLHARLASVARDQSLVEPLLEELLTGKVAYIGPIRQQLRPYAEELTEGLWATLRDEKAEVHRRFHAAVALAAYVPESDATSWTEQDLRFVAGQLVLANAEYQPLLRENLRPIHQQLLMELELIFGDAKSSDAQRLSAANAFADFASNDIPRLSKLLTMAAPEQYAVLYPLVAAASTPSTIEELGKIAATLPPSELGSVERVSYGQRRANAAVTLLRLGGRENVMPVFDMTDDPEAMTQFIFRCRERDVRVEELLECLRIANDGPASHFPKHTRYALLLGLGEYTLNEIPEPQQEPLLEQLADWYRNDPSSGVHGAAGWLLRQWGQHEIVRAVDQTAVPYAADREWFTLAIHVTPTMPSDSTADGASDADQTSDDGGAKLSEPQGEPLPSKTFYYTFIVFPAGKSLVGPFTDEPDRGKDEVHRNVTLTRPFAMLDREITMEELITFNPDNIGFMQKFDANPEDAGFGNIWYESVSFCRWLSTQSGLPESEQSYADPESLDIKNYTGDANPESNWAPRQWPLDLGGRGFRLPTEAEWEVASRAGVRTSYGYGSDVSLLDRFGWFMDNSGKHVHPPQKLRPGIRGLFDVHGNLFEWTHDWYAAIDHSDAEDPICVNGGSHRVIRGGGWSYGAAYCRTADRGPGDPAYRSNVIGFRLALSPSIQPTAEPGQGAKPVGIGTEGVAEQRLELP